MNTYLSIKYEEEMIKILDESANYKIVFFGASNAFITAEKRLSSILPIDYLCDNDQQKKGSEFLGYKIFNPEDVFPKNDKYNFLVIVTSMYFEEISLQLAKYKNIKNIISYKILPSLEYSINKNILIPKDISSKEIRKNELEIIINYIEPIESKYLSFSSYCNEIISRNNHLDKLVIVDCKYNLNVKLFSRILEYYIFDRLEHSNKPITIDIPYYLKDEFLNVINHTLDKFDLKKLKLVKKTQKFLKTRRHALIIHLYYIDLLETIYNEMKNIKDIFDIYISVTIDAAIEDIEKIKFFFPNANIFIFENRGRDVLPFLRILNKIYSLRYDTICKIHTKKSIDRINNGIEWGKRLRVELFNNSYYIIDKLLKSELNFYADEQSCKSVKDPPFYFSRKNVKIFSKYLTIKFNENFIVPSGTMFWCQTNRLYPLSNFKEYKYFSIEAGYLENQLEHTIELLCGLLFINKKTYLSKVCI